MATHESNHQRIVNGKKKVFSSKYCSYDIGVYY